MADIELTRTHALGLDEGRDAVERVAEQLESDIGVDYQWAGNVLRFDGQAADGEIEVEADRIEILINLSAFLRPMQRTIEQEAERYLDEYLQS